MSRPVSIDTPIMRRIIALMAGVTQPVDDEYIAKHAFVGRRTFGCNYRTVLIAAGKIHVAEYRRVRTGPFTAFYLPGPAPEGFVPPRPENAKTVETQRAWRERSGYYEKIKAERRLRRPPEPAMAALLGLPARYQKRQMAHNQENHA